MDWPVEESLEGDFALPPVMPSPLPEMSTHQKSSTPSSRLPADSTAHGLLTLETSTPSPVGQDHQQEGRAAAKNGVCPTPLINRGVTPEPTPDILPSLSHPLQGTSTTSTALTPAATCLRGRQAADRFLDSCIQLEVILVRFNVESTVIRPLLTPFTALQSLAY